MTFGLDNVIPDDDSVFVSKFDHFMISSNRSKPLVKLNSFTGQLLFDEFLFGENV